MELLAEMKRVLQNIGKETSTVSGLHIDTNGEPVLVG